VSDRRFDGVLFDAGGVLVVPDPYQTLVTLSPFGATLDPERHVRAHWAGLAALEANVGHAHDDTIERVPWTAYHRAFATVVGVGVHRLDDAAAALRSVFTPYLWTHPLAGSVAALARLRRAGVPMGVVSNADGQIEATLRYRGVCQVGEGAGVPVSCVVDSHVVGVAKPDPRIFDGAIAALGLPPERIAYVGDSVINDVGGATKAGLQPLLFDPYDDRSDLPHVERLASLHDLIAFFR
jgi:putative hydrolase of the HAD superfamily